MSIFKSVLKTKKKTKKKYVRKVQLLKNESTKKSVVHAID